MLLSISGCIFFGIIAIFIGCIVLRVIRKPGFTYVFWDFLNARLLKIGIIKIATINISNKLLKSSSYQFRHMSICSHLSTSLRIYLISNYQTKAPMSWPIIFFLSHSWWWIQARRGRPVSQHGSAKRLWWYVGNTTLMACGFGHHFLIYCGCSHTIGYFWNEHLWNYLLTLSR